MRVIETRTTICTRHAEASADRGKYIRRHWRFESLYFPSRSDVSVSRRSAVRNVFLGIDLNKAVEEFPWYYWALREGSIGGSNIVR